MKYIRNILLLVVALFIAVWAKAQIAATGTGFFISNDGYIVTCYHVIEDADWKNDIYVTAVRHDYEKSYQTQVVAVDRQNDIAILKISDFGQISLPYTISNQVNRIAESIYTIGYPKIWSMGVEPKFTDGKINALTGFQDDISSYQISAPVQSGNSGSPLFNNKGEVIGIISSIHTGETQNVNYAIKSTLLQNLIASCEQTIRIPIYNALAGKSIPDQVELIKKYVVLVVIAEEGDKSTQTTKNEKQEKTNTETTATEEFSDEAYQYYVGAMNGNANAQCNLALCYYNGKGVFRSYTKAIFWFKKSAEQCHARAQCELGYCYVKGIGVSQSYSNAVHWFANSALQGNARAQYNLGACYYNGNGVEKSYNKAVYWLTKSANQGYEYAIDALKQIRR